MKQFQLSLYKGHPIIKEGDLTILIDTGSTSTIHISEGLRFLSSSYRCSTNYMGLTVSEISDMLGTEISTLLGADILKEYSLLIDYKNKVIGFSEQKIDTEGQEVPVSNFMGVPIIELKIKDQELKFFLDTGAKLSYLPSNITENYESAGTEEDLYPLLGKFKTQYYEISTKIGDNTFMAKYGNLPSLLQGSLELAGVDGIIGHDFFNNFKVMLDLNDNIIKYS